MIGAIIRYISLSLSKKKEENSMEKLGENNGNDNDNHGDKKPSGTPRPQNKETLETNLSETETPDEKKASSDTPHYRKNDSDQHMNPNEKKEKSMETLGENNGNDNDNHGGTKPSGKPRPQNKETLDTDLSETEPPDENKASSGTPQNEGDNTEIYRRNSDPDVNARTQSNNYQSTSEEDQSRRFSEEDTSTEFNDLVTGDEVREETAVASNEKSEDDSPSQSVQNENIDPDNIDNKNMQRSVSITTNSSPDFPSHLKIGNLLVHMLTMSLMMFCGMGRLK